MNLRAEVIGFDRVRFALDHLTESVSDLAPLFEIAGNEFYAEEKDLFARAPWKPLTPVYAEQKHRRFGDKPILRATDRLYQSLTEKEAEGNVHRVDSFEAVFGSVNSYGGFHRRTRDPMAEPDVDRYGSLAGEYLEELAREAGFN